MKKFDFLKSFFILFTVHCSLLTAVCQTGIMNNGANIIIPQGAIVSAVGNCNGNFAVATSGTTQGTVALDGVLQLDANLTNNTDPLNQAFKFANNSGEVIFEGSCQKSIGGTGSEIKFPSLTLADGASVTVPAGQALYINKDFTNNGPADLGPATYQFTGTNGNQKINGTCIFNNLVINNTSGVTLNGAVSVKGILFPTEGTLSTNGNPLTLLSTSEQTALIAGVGNGSVIGNDVIMQRYISGTDGDHFLASPFTNATAGEITAFAQGSPVWGQNYSKYSGGSLSDIWYYDETNTAQTIPYGGSTSGQNGWMAPASASSILTPMLGYSIYVNSKETAYLNGQVNDGPVSLNVTHTNSATPNDDGWNLVANPYPSPIDWNAAGWNRTNVTAGLYLFKTTSPQGGVWSTYVDGVSLNGGSNIISSMQAFEINVTADGVLGVTNSVRTEDLSSGYFKKITDNDIEDIRLNVSSKSAINDEAVICFNENATKGFDNEYDASKLLNTEPNSFNVYTLGENKKYAVNSLPKDFSSDVVIPLVISAPVPGNTIIKATEINNIEADVNIYLEDSKTGTIQDLRENPIYQIDLTQGELNTNNRLTIRFTKQMINPNSISGSSSVIVNAYAANNKLYVSYSNPSKSTATLGLYDLEGREIFSQPELNNGYYNYSLNLPVGCYIIKILSPESSYVNKLYIR